MAKAKTSAKQKVSLTSTQSKKRSRTVKKNMGVDIYNPTKALLDEDRIARAIWECLKNDDPEGVLEVIQIYLQAINRSQQANKKSMLAKSHHTIWDKNAIIKTLAKLAHPRA